MRFKRLRRKIKSKYSTARWLKRHKLRTKAKSQAAKYANPEESRYYAT